MLQTRVIPPAENAYQYPLLIKSLLLSGVRYERDREIVYRDQLRYTYPTLIERVARLANALTAAGVKAGDTVGVMDWDSHRYLECMFAIPMLGAVLQTINVRLSPEHITYTMNHAEAKFVLCNSEFVPVFNSISSYLHSVQKTILLTDGEEKTADLFNLVGEYEQLLAAAGTSYDFEDFDENSVATTFYTSGTTGNPKGVVVHHRGAYLGALSNLVSWGMPPQSVYLWTLPMFHCNGWCFPWAMAANSGTNVCLRKVEAQPILQAIREHKVSHYCGAPIVQAMLINAPAEQRSGIEHEVATLVAGAAPPVAIIEGMSQMGFDLTHVYGLTETYGPSSVCAKHADWQALGHEEQARLNARQGVPYHCQEGISVRDPETMQEVPRDGETMGEIMFRGNLVMKGYLKNPTATEESFVGGWYHTGDLAVMHADGYVKIKDRSKDVIISGGENISSIEVEDVLYRHPAVIAAAVVAAPDEKWGEVPCAFLELREGHTPSAEELTLFCRERIARFKVPKQFIFGPLPKTTTGKIQKFVLREQVRSTSALD